MLHIADGVVHLQNQIPETVLSIECRANHQSIGQETHQRLQLRVMAVGNGAAHGQIILAAVATKQQGKGAEHNGVERGLLVTGQLLQLAGQGFGQSKLTALPPVIKLLWTGVIQWQIKRLQPGQLLLPPLALALHQVLLPGLLLPEGKIEIVNGQGRQGGFHGGFIPYPCLIKRSQFPAENVQ